MKKSILKLVTFYLAWLLLFLLQKPCFMVVYRDLFRGERVDIVFQVMCHGLPLDLSVAAYFTAFPGLLLIAQLWFTRMSRWPWRIYFALAASIYAVTFLLNLVLYRYWGFPLDTTPFYYFLSSPADALASVSGWFVALGIGAVLVLAVLVWRLMMSLVGGARLPWYPLQRRLGYSVVLLLCVGLLILPMRGGLTVSVMNTGEAYFSTNMRLNHAAINPVFSLLESYSKQVDFAAQYRFMPEKQARHIFRSMVCTRRANSDTLLCTRRPNIYIVILESFSRKVMETDATPHLNALRKEGLFFDNFYANSFRTDRGILSILSGYPAQPTTSLMRYPAKTDKLPSIGKMLQQQGYALHYYYGGDANFTNMRSYLTSMGFTHIVSDGDFPLSARLSKWGVPDHLVFQRALDDAKKAALAQALPPQLNVIQTSSSHELRCALPSFAQQNPQRLCLHRRVGGTLHCRTEETAAVAQHFGHHFARPFRLLSREHQQHNAATLSHPDVVARRSGEAGAGGVAIWFAARFGRHALRAIRFAARTISFQQRFVRRAYAPFCFLHFARHLGHGDGRAANGV